MFFLRSVLVKFVSYVIILVENIPVNGTQFKQGLAYVKTILFLSLKIKRKK